MTGHRFDFFTFDKILGLEKTTQYTSRIIDGLIILDKANESLYAELIKVKKENEKLKKQIERGKNEV